MIQVIKTKCCGKVFAACREPECYTDTEWTRELSKYVKKGNVVEMVGSGHDFKFETCDCANIAITKEPNLFSNQ